ncbi:hypothetical protein ACP70R_025470 [Stipagrostis hirtigluma subsp. patula]
MADRWRGDGMRQRPFASAQERVFDGGGSGGGGGGPALAFGGDFDQGSTYMELLGGGVNPQLLPPPPSSWAIDEPSTVPAINLTPQYLANLPNYTATSYQHTTTSYPAPPLGGSLQPYSTTYLQADPPPPQWPPPRPTTPGASFLLPPASFSVLLPGGARHDQHHHMQPRAAASFFGGGSSQAPAPVAIEQPAKDGYSWRKYGQKQLKDAESPRSYYKCTRDGCPVKKVVERSFDGFITEITYKGRHNHPRPPQRGLAAGGTDAAVELDDGPSDDDDDDDDVLNEDLDGDEGRDRGADAEGGQRVVKKPKIIIQTPSEVDLLDDGYRWRKYGQKVVKGNPRPRSYYKCTADNCNVRKQIERASTDTRCVLTTYTGRHNHDPPGRGGAEAATAGGSSADATPSAVNPAGESGTLHQTGDARQLKEES